MKKVLKTLLVSLLAVVLLCSAVPAAFAADAKEAEIYTIGLDAMGGTTSVVVVTTNLSGKLSALPEQPTLEGYTFDGWFNGETKLTAETVISGDSTYTAKWTAITYTIAFSGGSESTGSVESIPAAYCSHRACAEPGDPGSSGRLCCGGCAVRHAGHRFAALISPTADFKI